MLKFILSDRPTALIREIHNAVAPAADSGEVLLFTPDQFSFKLEKLVYERFSRDRRLNIKVTTPSRFSAELLKKHGMNKGYADDAVKYAVMYKTLAELKKPDISQLGFYGDKRLGAELVDFSLGMVRTFKTAGVTPAALRSLLNSENDFPEALSDKLSDLLLIYLSYDTALKRDFEDRLDDIIRAERLARETARFEGASCFFVGFDDFSGNQMILLKAIIETAKSACFMLLTDGIVSEQPQFECINAIIARLSQYAEEPPSTELLPADKYPDLKPDHRYSKIVRCGDVWQECAYIAAEIRRLVMHEGYRYKDILVLSRGDYGSVMKSAAVTYDIPLFADIPSSIADKPLIKFIFTLLNALSLETDDIMCYVKSGFVRVENENGELRLLEKTQLYELEKFVRAYGITRRDWLSPFPERLTAKYTVNNPELLRKQIIAPLKKLRSQVENADADVITERLCEFLFSTAKIDGSIYGICKAGEGEGSDNLPVDTKKVAEYRRIWDLAADVFESVHDALRGCKMPVREYSRVLRDIFRKTSTATPPEVLDAVTCGDIERTRTDGAKIVFVCGFNEGAVPAPIKPANGFSGRENELLTEYGIAVGENRRCRSSREKFLAYKALTLTSGSIIITYPLLDGGFKERQPSQFLPAVSAGLHIAEITADSLDAAFYCATERAAEQYAYARYNRDKRTALSVLDAISDGESRERLAAIINMQSFDAYRHRLSSATAAELFERESYSPSALETAAGCHFAYFCKYGLGLFDDGEKEITPAEIGNAMHFALKYMLEAYKGRYGELAAAAPSALRGELTAAFKAYESELYPDGIGESPRFSYVLGRLSKTAALLLTSMAADMNEHGFIPEDFEREVSYTLGDSVRLQGRFDRLDIHISPEGNKYIRVIDYKTGGKKMPLETVFYGKNLQMLLYLFGLCEGDVKPSGVGYIAAGAVEKVKTTTYDMEKDGIQPLDERCREKYKPSGVAVEENYPDRRCENVMSDRNFALLRDYCERYVVSEINELKSGAVDAMPVVEMKKRSEGVAKAPCDYCKFSAFCGNSNLKNYIAITSERMEKAMESDS